MAGRVTELDDNDWELPDLPNRNPVTKRHGLIPEEPNLAELATEIFDHMVLAVLSRTVKDSRDPRLRRLMWRPGLTVDLLVSRNPNLGCGLRRPPSCTV